MTPLSKTPSNKARHFLACLLFLFTLLSANGSNVQKEAWVLAPFHGATPLATQLKKLGIPVDISKNTPVSPETFKVFGDKQSYKKIPLEGMPFTLYHVTEGGFPSLHMALAFPSLLDTREETEKALYNTLLSLLKTLRKIGYAHYYLFVDFEKEYPFPGTVIEIIPIEGTLNPAFNFHFVDIHQKLERILYGLFQKSPSPSLHDEPLIPLFVKNFNYKDYSLNQDDNPPSSLPWLFVYRNISSLFEDVLPMLKTFLEKNNYATFLPIKTTFVDELGDIFSLNTLRKYLMIPFWKTKEGCAFCSPHVIQKQYMLLGNHVTLLFNYTPYTPEGHFLVVPKKHKEFFDQVTYDEFKEMLHFAKEMTLLYFKNDNVIWFLQNGPRAGQTAPHTHIHVLKRPSPPWYFFTEWSKEFLVEEPIMYGKKEFNQLREKVSLLRVTH